MPEPSATNLPIGASDGGVLRFPPVASLDHVSEEDLWNLLVADGIAEAEAGRAVTLRRYLDSLPKLGHDHPGLHAAIAATLENGRRRRVDPDTLLAQMRVAHPHLAEQIDEANLVRELLGDEGDDEEDTRRPSRTLPCGYGPESWEGHARYELTALLGVGTRGYVYKAIDRTMSSEDKPAWVAIKVVPEWTEMALADVLAEARRAKRVEHQSVARVIDAGEFEDECFIVCEFVEGSTLVDWRAERGGVSPRLAVGTMLPVVDALAVAHAAGLVHLDVHPRNVMISYTGRPKLIDFGLGLTNFEAWRPARRPLGSLGFIAPEIYQREAHPALPRADVYSLGGLVLWLLTEHIPNGQSIEETEFRLNAEAGSPSPPVGGLDRIADPDLRAVLGRALARDPADRYDSARGLWADLQAWLERRPLAWTNPGPWRRFTLFATRAPGALAATVLIVGLSIAGSIAITAQRVTHAADLRVVDAERREELATIEAERLADQAALGEQVQRFAGTLQGFVRSDPTRRAAGRDWVVLLTLVQGLSDSGMRLDADVLATVMDDRITIARGRIEETSQQLGESDVQTRLWRAALVSWLIDAQRFDEALAELRIALPYWDDAHESLGRRLTLTERALEALTESDADALEAVLRDPDAEQLPVRLRERMELVGRR